MNMKDLLNIGDVVLRAILSLVLLPFGAVEAVKSFLSENVVGVVCFALLAIIGVEFIKSTIKDIKKLKK